MNNKDYKQLINYFTIFLALSSIACIMGVTRVILTKEVTFLFLVWNLFLCWVPFLISVVIYRSCVTSRIKNNKLFILILGLVWLLFFPNAPYMITDYIHFSYIDFLVPPENIYSSFAINNDFIIWYDFILFSLFIFTGFLIGLYSMFLIHTVLKEKFNNRTGWFFVLFIYLLSGFGIYLGRFLRFNSWDLFLDPLNLFSRIISIINSNSLMFTAMFGVFLFIVYLVFYKFIYRDVSSSS